MKSLHWISVSFEISVIDIRIVKLIPGNGNKVLHTVASYAFLLILRMFGPSGLLQHQDQYWKQGLVPEGNGPLILPHLMSLNFSYPA